MSGEPGYIRWIPSEWRIVAASATPHIIKGKSVLAALIAGQRALPKERRRQPDDLKKLPWQQSCKNYLAEAAKLTPAQLAEIAPPPPPRKKPEPRKSLDEERTRNQRVLLPVRIDDAVMQTSEAWARLLRGQRNIGDFSRWKEHNSYQKSFDRLMRDLRAETSKQ